MAIMPLEERTMPSRRRVLTCRPAFPGGRFLAAEAAACCRPTKDSKGSLRPARLSLSESALPSTGLAAGLVAPLPAFLVGDFLPGEDAGLPAGFAAGCVVCASNPGVAAASKI